MTVSLHHTILGDGQPLIVMHGLFGSSTNWRSLSRALARSWQVHTLDLRNHGQSPHSDAMSYLDMARDLSRYLDDRGLESATILGHSMGGKVAMRFALDEPKRVDRLIVVDIAPIVSDHDHTPYLRAMQEVALNSISRREDAALQLEDAVPEPGLRQFLLQNLVGDEDGYRWRINLEGIDHNLEELLAFPRTGDHERYEGPTLFVRGETSDYILDESHAEIRRLFPSAEIVTIENAGHWVQAEKPTEFLKAVKGFLDKPEG